VVKGQHFSYSRLEGVNGKSFKDSRYTKGSRPLYPSHGRTVGSEPPRGIAYWGFKGRKNFFSTAEVAKCRASRARVNTWHIR
jgi:hypothetical protein